MTGSDDRDRLLSPAVVVSNMKELDYLFKLTIVCSRLGQWVAAEGECRLEHRPQTDCRRQPTDYPGYPRVPGF